MVVWLDLGIKEVSNSLNYLGLSYYYILFFFKLSINFQDIHYLSHPYDSDINVNSNKERKMLIIIIHDFAG